jgi:cytochrome c biogenesis protein CcmG/thiol:disulfide interchange protein DsbE
MMEGQRRCRDGEDAVRLALVGVAFVAVLSFLGITGYALARQNGMTSGRVAATGGGAGQVFGSGQLVDAKPRPAPLFALTLFSGSRWQLSDHRGKPVVVNFWASWCPPCQDEAPVLQQGWLAYRDRVDFIGVDVWDTDKEAQAFLRDHGATYPSAPDPAGNVAVNYGLTGVPETFFLDRNGQIIHHYIGPLDAASLKSLLDSLLQP